MTTAELSHGPVDDFNVIVQRGRMRVNVHALSLAVAGARAPIPLDFGPATPDRPPAFDLLVHVPEGHALLHVTGQRGPIPFGPR